MIFWKTLEWDELLQLAVYFFSLKDYGIKTQRFLQKIVSIMV